MKFNKYDGNIAALNAHQDKIDSDEEVLSFAGDENNFPELMANLITDAQARDILEEVLLLNAVGKKELVNLKLTDLLCDIESLDNARDVMGSAGI